MAIAYLTAPVSGNADDLLHPSISENADDLIGRAHFEQS